MKNISIRKKEKERKTAVENSVFNSELWKTLWKKDGEATMTKDYIYWTCPYYRSEDEKGVHCEGGRVKLPTAEAEKEYIRFYCADHLGWKRCTVARAVTRFYERAFEEEM